MLNTTYLLSLSNLSKYNCEYYYNTSIKRCFLKVLTPTINYNKSEEQSDQRRTTTASDLFHYFDQFVYFRKAFLSFDISASSFSYFSYTPPPPLAHHISSELYDHQPNSRIPITADFGSPAYKGIILVAAHIIFYLTPI